MAYLLDPSMSITAKDIISEILEDYPGAITNTAALADSVVQRQNNCFRDRQQMVLVCRRIKEELMEQVERLDQIVEPVTPSRRGYSGGDFTRVGRRSRPQSTAQDPLIRSRQRYTEQTTEEGLSETRFVPLGIGFRGFMLDEPMLGATHVHAQIVLDGCEQPVITHTDSWERRDTTLEQLVLRWGVPIQKLIRGLVMTGFELTLKGSAMLFMPLYLNKAGSLTLSRYVYNDKYRAFSQHFNFQLDESSSFNTRPHHRGEYPDVVIGGAQINNDGKMRQPHQRRHTPDHPGRHEDPTGFTGRFPPDYAPPVSGEQTEDYQEYHLTLDNTRGRNLNTVVIRRPIDVDPKSEEIENKVDLHIAYRGTSVPYSNYKRSNVLEALATSEGIFTRYLDDGQPHSLADAHHQGNLVEYRADGFNLIGAIHNGLFYPFYIESGNKTVALSRVPFNDTSAVLYELVV